MSIEDTTFGDVREMALAIANFYDAKNIVTGRSTWSVQDYVTGFMGDVGDLAKLTQAKLGVRDQVDGSIEHELADCLFSVIVIAACFDVDLVDALRDLVTDITT